jgi:methylmalonyl-CoA/ethylmalonyl-CoA epimerase
MVDQDEPVRFDHVGLVVRRPTDLWPVMAGVLGGQYVGRGAAEGYGWTQLRFANGFILEGVHPEGQHRSEFLERFLDRSGVGPHHLTFHVADLAGTLEHLRARGLHPLAVDLANPQWQEASLHPDEAHGTVVQLIQNGPVQPPTAPAPEGFPDIGFDHPIASLGRVVHAVRDLRGALTLYRDLLDGRVVSSGSAVDGNHWVELGWGGPGRLRLLEGVHADIRTWVGDRTGRTRHLFFSFDEPSYVPGAHRVAPGRWVVDADDVLGTRLVIASSAR